MALLFMNFLILGLATWRISSLLVQEDGPFFIFERIRFISGIKWNEFGEAYSENIIGQILLCVWCLSVWIALLISLLYWIFGIWIVYICFPFALSGLACVAQGIANK